ncbi:MAG TPA: cytochrome P460 family protein [Opitutaceae bacterium]|jgi:hypothetical protein
MKLSSLLLVLAASAFFGFASLVADERAGANPPPVSFPDGFRDWMHVSSAVLLPNPDAASDHRDEKTVPAPHGLIHNNYANAKAVEGFRTGHFPEGSVLVVDWFVVEQAGRRMLQGQRKSVNVMVRDARYATTGGWGFEDFDQDSHTARNVGSKAVESCFECHRHASNHEYVFSELKPQPPPRHTTRIPL